MGIQCLDFPDSPEGTSRQGRTVPSPAQKGTAKVYGHQSSKKDSRKRPWHVPCTAWIQWFHVLPGKKRLPNINTLEATGFSLNKTDTLSAFMWGKILGDNVNDTGCKGQKKCPLG